MGATANVTTVLYGTAWTPDTLLEREKQRALELERRDGRRRHFQYDWRTLAALLPEYGAYVEGERARLGEGHLLFRTQYELETQADEGRLLSAAGRAQLQGDYRPQEGPLPGRRYVAGVDLAGGDVGGGQAGHHDSTVLTIAEASTGPTLSTVVDTVDRVDPVDGMDTMDCMDPVDGSPLPVVRVVRHYRWTGRGQAELYPQLLDLLRTWGVRRIVVDATGMGAGVAGFLAAALGERVEQFTFTQASKSKLGFELLAAIERGGLKVYGDDGSAEWREFWAQMRAARAHLRANQTLDFSVPEAEGHDDFVISLALCLRAASGVSAPAAATVLPAVDVLDDGTGEGFNAEIAEDAEGEKEARGEGDTVIPNPLRHSERSEESLSQENRLARVRDSSLRSE